jgi:hypothetical protein
MAMKITKMTPTMVSVEGHVSDEVTNAALVSAGITNYQWRCGSPETTMFYTCDEPVDDIKPDLGYCMECDAPATIGCTHH